MGIEIKKIEAKNLGPLEEFSHDLGKFNVIYGPNERGKTFLTEFILRCLFKDTYRWSLRKEGKGKIFVKGIKEGEISFFTASSELKLDNFLKEEKGLSPQLIKLLAVKGSDADIDADAEAKGGMSKSVVKELLTEKDLLEEIGQNIKPTVRKADINTEPIDINNQGEGKDLKELEKELKKLDDLIKEVEADYSPGYLEQLKIEKGRLEEEREEQSLAKRKRAYDLNEELKKTKKELRKYDQEEVTSLSLNIEEREKLREKIRKKEVEHEKEAEKAEKYRSLNKIREKYKELQEEVVSPLPKAWIVIPGALFVISVMLVIRENILFGVLGFAISFAVLVSYFYLYKKKFDQRDLENETRSLKEEFEELTGKKMQSIATLEAVMEEYRTAPEMTERIKQELKELSDEFSDLFTEIKRQMKNITGQEVDEKEWENKLTEIKNKREELEQKKEELSKELSSLNIDESDYAKEAPVHYSAEKMEELEEKIREKEEEIRKKEESLKSMEKRIAQHVEDDSGKDFSGLYQGLYQKRKRVEGEVKNKKSEIVAGKIVFDELESLREKEDERIKKNFESQVIQDHVAKMTKGRYKEVRLNGEELEVVGKFENFNLKDLSTGAREQILLALRVGLSAELLKKDSMFLILDDAFQNSDWERREELVESLADLSEGGWQVIYLTMDDHIRDLFKEKGKKFGDQFKSISLD